MLSKVALGINGFVLCCLMFVAQASLATGIQILPTRLVLEKQRSAELTLFNRSDKAGRYRISLRNIRTNKDGAFDEAKEAAPGELFADKLIRFSPRSVEINANAYQKVRLLVRKPRDLPFGEYRTHMVFRSMPAKTPSSLDQSTDVSVSVQPIIEISIPVIVRHGELSANITLSNPVLEGNRLTLDIGREGSRSLYGDLQIFRMENDKQKDRVGFVRGVSVYVPNLLRVLSLDLDVAPDKAQGKYLIHFKEDNTYGGDQEAKIQF